VPVKAITGFNTQELNTGSIKGNTIEATIQAQLIQRSKFSWEANLVADRSRNRITAFNRSCYTEGILNRCENVRLGTFWGQRYIRNTSQLRAVHANSADQFQVNDDGYLVPVGRGNSWTEGMSKNLWPTTVTIDGVNYAWGRPILEYRADNPSVPAYVQMGDGNPDLNFGFGNTIRWGGVQLYGLISGQLGGDIYNNARQTLYQGLDHGDVDQFGKPDERKKPTNYYNGNGLAFNNTGYVEEFVEDGTYAKLSELQLRYTFSQARLGALRRFGGDQIAVSLTGRNLFVWTNYTGVDPQVGSPMSRVDFETAYAPFRTYTLGVNVVF
jgi:hypothetical protein